MSAIIYWQNPCKLPMIFRRIKAYMLAFSGSFSRKCLEGISFNFFVCFIFNVSIGSAPKRKNFDIQRNTRVGLGRQFTSNRLSCHHMISNMWPSDETISTDRSAESTKFTWRKMRFLTIETLKCLDTLYYSIFCMNERIFYVPNTHNLFPRLDMSDFASPSGTLAVKLIKDSNWTHFQNKTGEQFWNVLLWK